MNTTAYLRVSSKAQDFPTQKAAIERAAAARGDTISTFFSEKKSGKTLARPVFDSVREAARRGEIRKLYVYRLDRLTRSGIRDTFEAVEELRAAGTEIVTVADGFSLEGPASEVILAVMAWAAKMERLAINERISAARERVEEEHRQGKRAYGWGRPTRGFSKKDRERGVAPLDPAQVLRMKTEGRTVREISIAVKAPKSTVARVLSKKNNNQPAPVAA